LSTRKWKGEDGKDRFTTEVVVRSAVGVIVPLDVRRQGGGESDDEAEAEAEAIEDVPSRRSALDRCGFASTRRCRSTSIVPSMGEDCDGG
jgi:single-stranded DNA-binding protein